MALTRAKKTQKVEVLAKELATSTSAIVGTFAKLTVSQDFALRQKVREAGGRYRVLKNKLAARASQGTQIEAALQGLKGVSSVAYTSGDPVALAKALSAWVKDNSEFTFKLGIVDGKVITVEEVQALATMPGKEELFAKLLFLINAPATRLATVLNATGRNLAVVVDQAVQQEKFAAAPAAKVAPAPVAEAAPAAEEIQAAVVEKAPEEIAAVSAAPVLEAAAPAAETDVLVAESTTPAAEAANDHVPTTEEVQAAVLAIGPEEIAAVTAHPASETAAPAEADAPKAEEAGS
jgi:large subunit ribosomal protein L10